jgi:hypothetical protein
MAKLSQKNILNNLFSVCMSHCNRAAQILQSVELLQQVFHRFKAGDISEALFKRGADFVESEGFGVVLAETGGIVGNGLIAGQGLLQGFYFRGDKGRREFHAKKLGDLFDMLLPLIEFIQLLQIVILYSNS